MLFEVAEVMSPGASVTHMRGPWKPVVVGRAVPTHRCSTPAGRASVTDTIDVSTIRRALLEVCCGV